MKKKFTLFCFLLCLNSNSCGHFNLFNLYYIDLNLNEDDYVDVDADADAVININNN